MHLGRVSFVASQDQLVDTLKYLVCGLGIAFDIEMAVQINSETLRLN